LRRALDEPWRTRAAVAGIGLLSLAGYGLGFPRALGRGPATHEVYVLVHLGLFLLYVGAVGLVLRDRTADRGVLAIVLGAGLLFRLAVLPTPVVLSSDLYRYLWDGRVQRSGVSPYRYPPAAEELRVLRDAELWPGINRPTQRTVYPPGAEIVYRAVTVVAPDSIRGWRLFVLLCEGATIGLLLGLLRRMGEPETAVVVYAWAPLAVFEGAQAGHVDFVMLPLLLLALRLRQAGHMARSGLVLGCATLVKLYPAVLLPAWLGRGDWRFPAAWVATMTVGYLAFLGGVGPGVLGFLPRYFGSAEDFNIGLRLFVTDGIGLVLGAPGRRALGAVVAGLLERLGQGDVRLAVGRLLSPEEAQALRRVHDMPTQDLGEVLLQQLGSELVRALVMVLLLGVLALVLVRIGRRRPPGPAGVFRAAMAAVAAYLVLVPTAMHAWYAVWILPFLAARRSPAWVWFTGMVSLSYLKYAWDGLPLWVRLVEYLPLYGLLLWEWRRGRARGAPDGCGPATRPV